MDIYKDQIIRAYGTFLEQVDQPVQQEGDLIRIRAEGVINAAPEAVFNLVKSSKAVSQWIPLVNQMEIGVPSTDFEPMYVPHTKSKIRFVDNELVYCRLAPYQPLQARDWCMVRYCVENEDSSYTVGFCSVTHDKYPETNEFVRAELLPSGITISPYPHGTGDSTDSSLVTALFSFHLGGAITYLMKMLFRSDYFIRQAGHIFIYGMKKALENTGKEAEAPSVTAAPPDKESHNQQIFELFEADSTQHHEGWQHITAHGAQGEFHAYTTHTDTLSCTKAQFGVGISPEELFAFFSSPPQWKMWLSSICLTMDGMQLVGDTYECPKTIKNLGNLFFDKATHKVLKMCFQSPGPPGPDGRIDFCVLQSCFLNSEHRTATILFRSIVTDLVPHSPDVARGTLKTSGFLVKLNPDGKTSDVTSVLYLDFADQKRQGSGPAAPHHLIVYAFVAALQLMQQGLEAGTFAQTDPQAAVPHMNTHGQKNSSLGSPNWWEHMLDSEESMIDVDLFNLPETAVGSQDIGIPAESLFESTQLMSALAGNQPLSPTGAAGAVAAPAGILDILEGNYNPGGLVHSVAVSSAGSLSTRGNRRGGSGAGASTKQGSTTGSKRSRKASQGANSSAPAAKRQSRRVVPADDKGRIMWVPELHASFVESVQKLGEDTARPQAILELMQVEGLTKEHVKSHLQKYRLRRKKEKEKEAERRKKGALAPSHANTQQYQHPHAQQQQHHPHAGQQHLGNGGAHLSLLQQQQQQQQQQAYGLAMQRPLNTPGVPVQAQIGLAAVSAARQASTSARVMSPMGGAVPIGVNGAISAQHAAVQRQAATPMSQSSMNGTNGATAGNQASTAAAASTSASGSGDDGGEPAVPISALLQHTDQLTRVAGQFHTMLNDFGGYLRSFVTRPKTEQK